MSDIYHITRRVEWDAAASTGIYAPKSLEHEGFIHCSTRWQILDIANTMFRGQTDLVLLRIDTKSVSSGIRNEDCYGTGQSFPHIYGPLNMDAVKRFHEFAAGEDGKFTLPRELA